MLVDPTGFTEDDPWWNDSGWDYIQIWSWGAWAGNGVGSAWGWGANFGSNWKIENELSKLHKENGMATGNIEEYTDSMRFGTATGGSVRILAQGNYEFYGIVSGMAGGGRTVGGVGSSGDDIIRNEGDDVIRNLPPGRTGSATTSKSGGAAHIHDEAFSGNRYFDPGDASRKHGSTARRGSRGRTINEAPLNGQEALDNSWRISPGNPNAPRRVGVDIDNQQIVVFDRTGNHFVDGEIVGGSFHGHVRRWNELTNDMQQLLRENGIRVRNSGKIIWE